MLIAIIGTRCSGKSSVEDYLVFKKGFKLVRLFQPGDSMNQLNSEDSEDPSNASTSTYNSSSVVQQIHQSTVQMAKHFSFLSMSPLPSPAPVAFRSSSTLEFISSEALLEFVTKNWQDCFVTMDLCTRELVEKFLKRPFFMLLSIDAPLIERFRRQKSDNAVTLEDFVREDDGVVFGGISRLKGSSSLQSMSDLVNIQITNSYKTISALFSHLDDLDLLNPEHLRPGWDAYFMTLASLASCRSNCMKRRVGAVLVRDNRIIATGYNGTPRGLANCNDGGCPSCNGTTLSSETPFECVCLHAEENALLEAGRERVGTDAVLYCNTCPCLRCTIKIIQTGVKSVVYNLTYKVDDASALLFEQAGVQLRRYDPNKRFRLLTAEDQVELLEAITSDTK